MERRHHFNHQSAQLITTILALGLYFGSFFLDLGYFATSDPLIVAPAFWMTTTGIAVGLVAALLSWIEWFTCAVGNSGRAVIMANAVILTAVLFLFIGNWHFRLSTPGTIGPRAAMLSFLGASVAFVAAVLLKEKFARYNSIAKS